MYFRVSLIILPILQATIVSGFQDCPSAVVGLADSNIIPDSSFTATSYVNDKYVASKARFTSTHCWQPKGNSNDDYLQIDLGKVFVICAVATKGNYAIDEWTTKYKISTSIDGTTSGTGYPENNNIQEFAGNTDRNTPVKNVLNVPVLVKLIRFTPTKWNNYKALRVELYGIAYHDSQICTLLSVGVANKIPDKRITSSTNYNISTQASNGRLGYNAGSSWCSATSDSSPYLQIDLSTPYVICGIATKGDHMSNQWVQTYQIQVSTDGNSFTDYKKNSISKESAGNFDSNTIVQNVLYDGTVGQYIRIRPTRNYGSTSCMRIELYGVQQNTVCSRISIGVASSTLVPDHRFAASSYFRSSYAPRYARLRNTRAWEPAMGQNDGSWLHIDLGSVVYICTVETQGNPNPAQEYVKKYKLRTSLDNINWKYYQENNVDKIFIGNTDKDSIVTNTLAVPTKVKFLRFYPTEYQSFAAMRVEVYGVALTCRKPFGLEKGGNKGNIRMTSSSKIDNSHDASDGRLYGDASWCSSTSSKSQYIQVYFGKMVTLTGIATQGDHTMDKWVKTYTVKYSIDGNQWNDYREGGNTKIFQGNSDKSSIVVRWLSKPLTVKYVRVHPQSWNTAICMRIELFGCIYPSPPEIKDLTNQNLTPSSGSYVELTCKVQEPLIQDIGWYFNGTDITSLSGGITRDVNSVKSVLRVNYTNAADIISEYQCFKKVNIMVCRRNYLCKAKYGRHNSKAESVQSAQVQVTLDMSPILPSPFLHNVLVHSVIVGWSYPLYAYLKTVMVKYWKHPRTTIVSYVSYPATNLTITGLSACTDYYVTIKAVSELGGGPWSNVTNFRTDSELPKVAPSSVTTQAKTSQSILVTWQVPAEVLCSPDGYKVVFSTAPGGPTQDVFVSGFHNTTYTLTNLDKWTDYYISVKVHNEKGDGPPSGVVRERTLEDKPDAAPANFQAKAINSTSVRLSWNLPPGNQQNGVIRGFKVYYYKTLGISCPPGKSPQIHVQGNKTLQYILGNLAVHTEYSFKILAYTIKDGPYSQEVTQKTHQIGVPGVERALSYVSMAINVVLVAIIIVLLIYIRRLRNHINSSQGKTKRNSAGNLPDQIAYENTCQASEDGIQMNEIPITTSPEYEAMDQFQQQDLPPHFDRSDDGPRENTKTSYQPPYFDDKQQEDVYEELDQNAKSKTSYQPPFDDKQQGEVYEELDQNAKSKTVLANDARSEPSVYQSLDKDDSQYEGLHIYGNEDSQSQI